MVIIFQNTYIGYPKANTFTAWYMYQVGSGLRVQEWKNFCLQMDRQMHRQQDGQVDACKLSSLGSCLLFANGKSKLYLAKEIW